MATIQRPCHLGGLGNKILGAHCRHGDTQSSRRPYALSWKPCQGDSLSLPDHRIHKDGDGDASFQLKSDSLPHAHAHSTKTFYKHRDSKNQESSSIKDKDFRKL
ncbi:hypothetical protein Tco_0145482 [Tanacetum coccineum]